MTLTVQIDRDRLKLYHAACQISRSQSISLKSYHLGVQSVGHTHTSDLLLYLDHVMTEFTWLKQDPHNVGNSRVAVALSTAELRKYQNTTSGTFGRRSSTPMVAFDSQGMTSY